MAKTKKLTVEKQSVLDWCNEMTNDGHELKIQWDGGNDSGWAEFILDGESFENKHSSILVDKMYDLLDYGSWAGEYSASGSAIYVVEEQAFIGQDSYSQTDSQDWELNYKLKIPKELWFDTVNLHIEADNDSNNDVTLDFSIKNGFTTNQHQEIAEKIAEEISEAVNEAIDEFTDRNDSLDSIWEDFDIEFKEFEQTKDGLEFTIDSINIRYNNTIPKEIHLDVKQIQEEINEKH